MSQEQVTSEIKRIVHGQEGHSAHDSISSGIDAPAVFSLSGQFLEGPSVLSPTICRATEDLQFKSQPFQKDEYSVSSQVNLVEANVDSKHSPSVEAIVDSKHSPSGIGEDESLLNSVLSRGKARHSFLKFDIVDDGIGMHKDVQARTFNPFVQGERLASSRKHGGFGIGLALCHKLVQLLGGAITVESPTVLPYSKDQTRQGCKASCTTPMLTLISSPIPILLPTRSLTPLPTSPGRCT